MSPFRLALPTSRMFLTHITWPCRRAVRGCHRSLSGLRLRDSAEVWRGGSLSSAIPSRHCAWRGVDPATKLTPLEKEKRLVSTSASYPDLARRDTADIKEAPRPIAVLMPTRNRLVAWLRDDRP